LIHTCIKVDWITNGRSRLEPGKDTGSMAKAIDNFLNTDLAKKNGIFSRTNFVVRLVSGWFSQYEKEFGIFVLRTAVRNTDDKIFPSRLIDEGKDDKSHRKHI